MSDLNSFLTTTGRTLAQMALYSEEHPSVKQSIVESHRLLCSVLQEEQEDLVLSMSEGTLLVNGRLPEKVPESALRPFAHLMEIYDLHSLSFLPGIGPEELIAFFKLSSRASLRKKEKDVSVLLSSPEVLHIKFNLTKYAKIGEDETIGSPAREGTDSGGGDPLWKEIDRLSLGDLLKKLIGRAVEGDTDQKKVFERVFDLVKNEIDQTVAKVTSEFNVVRTRLTNERERVEGVVGNMADGVVVVDETGNVLMMNPAAESIYGVNLGDCLGKPLWEGVKQEQMVSLAKDLTIPSDRPMVKEVEVRATEDTKKTLKGSTAAVQDPHGRVVGMISVLSDVTKQQELARAQNEFVANVTHELRTPLHALKLAMGGILDGSAGPVTNDQEKMLSLADRNLTRLSRLIDDILDFSKLESGALEIHPQIIEMAPLLKESIGVLESWAANQRIQLIFEEGANTPPVYADSDRVLQVVINLLSNAIKFSPRGGKVIVRARNVKDQQKNMVQVEVEDNGKGISQEDRKKIFDRFVQLQQSPRHGVRGTGLGLSICQALIELHKGTLSLLSPPPAKSQGTLFFFTLPAVRRASGTPAKTGVHVPLQAAGAKPKKLSLWKKITAALKLSSILLLLTASTLQARPRWGTVRRVLEGDLIQLQGGDRVRYLGVDAPDLGSSHYVESLSANKHLVENKEIRLRYGLQERDVDGVWLAYVFADGVFVNKNLVRNGHAIVKPLSNDEKYLPDLISAEREALRAKRGIWRDIRIDPYNIRVRKKKSSPWATTEEIKKGMIGK